MHHCSRSAIWFLCTWRLHHSLCLCQYLHTRWKYMFVGSAPCVSSAAEFFTSVCVCVAWVSCPVTLSVPKTKKKRTTMSQRQTTVRRCTLITTVTPKFLGYDSSQTLIYCFSPPKISDMTFWKPYSSGKNKKQINPLNNRFEHILWRSTCRHTIVQS